MKAMILAAGLGTRLGQLTRSSPKCLMDVGGVTMLERVIFGLKSAGVVEVVVNLHHLAEQVEAKLQEKHNFGLKVNLSREPCLLGTGGGVKNARRFLDSSEDFFIYNADIFSDFDLTTLLTVHRQQPPSLATLLTMNREDSSYLTFNQEGELQGSYKVGNDPAPNSGLEIRAFCGVQIVSPRIFAYMERQSAPFSLIETYKLAVSCSEKIHALDIGSAYWTDIGSPERLEEIRRRFESPA